MFRNDGDDDCGDLSDERHRELTVLFNNTVLSTIIYEVITLITIIYRFFRNKVQVSKISDERHRELTVLFTIIYQVITLITIVCQTFRFKFQVSKIFANFNLQ